MDDDKLLRMHMEDDRTSFGRLEGSLASISAKIDNLMVDTAEIKAAVRYAEIDRTNLARRIYALETKAQAGEIETVKLSERLKWPAIVTSILLSVVGLASKIM